MATLIPPIPNQPVSNTHEWRDWFFNVGQNINTGGIVRWDNIVFDGSSITSIVNRQHNSLQGLQGGAVSGTEYFHLSSPQFTQVSNFFNYGQWYNTADQTFSATTATQVVFNTTAFSSGMSLASNTITVNTAGIYNVTYSLQLANTDTTSIRYASIWLKQNGTDVVGSGSKFNVPNHHGSLDGYTVAVSNVVLTCAAGDTIQLWAGVEATNVYIEYYAAQTTPFAMPSIPSSIITIQQVA